MYTVERRKETLQSNWALLESHLSILLSTERYILQSCADQLGMSKQDLTNFCSLALSYVEQEHTCTYYRAMHKALLSAKCAQDRFDASTPLLVRILTRRIDNA